jgi:hypothetical protein
MIVAVTQRKLLFILGALFIVALGFQYSKLQLCFYLRHHLETSASSRLNLREESIQEPQSDIVVSILFLGNSWCNVKNMLKTRFIGFNEILYVFVGGLFLWLQPYFIFLKITVWKK